MEWLIEILYRSYFVSALILFENAFLIYLLIGLKLLDLSDRQFWIYLCLPGTIIFFFIKKMIQAFKKKKLDRKTKILNK